MTTIKKGVVRGRLQFGFEPGKLFRLLLWG